MQEPGPGTRARRPVAGRHRPGGAEPAALHRRHRPAGRRYWRAHRPGSQAHVAADAGAHAADGAGGLRGAGRAGAPWRPARGAAGAGAAGGRLIAAAVGLGRLAADRHRRHAGPGRCGGAGRVARHHQAAVPAPCRRGHGAVLVDADGGRRAGRAAVAAGGRRQRRLAHRPGLDGRARAARAGAGGAQPAARRGRPLRPHGGRDLSGAAARLAADGLLRPGQRRLFVGGGVAGAVLSGAGLERGGQRQPARGPDGMPGGRGVAAAGAGPQARGPPALAVADPGPAGGGFRRPGVAAGRGAHRLGHAAGGGTGRLLRPVADRGAGPSAGSPARRRAVFLCAGRRLPDRGGAAWIVAALREATGGFRDGWLLHLACVAVVAALYLRAAPSSYARAMAAPRADAARAGSGGS